MLNTDDKNQDLAAAATASLRLTAGENPDAVAMALQKSRELGIPYIWAREMDNADLQPDVTAEGLNPRLQKVLAENVDRAPIYRGHLPDLNRAANVLDDIEMSPLERYEELSRERGPEGLQMLNARDWAKLGYRLMPSGELVKYGQTVPPPVRMGDIVSGDEERALVDRTLEALKKSTGFNLSDWESFLVMSQAGKKEVLGGFLAQVERENALLRQLNADYPEGWIDKSDQGVRERIASIEKRFNVDLSDISIDRLRKGGLMDVDYLEAANLFGVRDIFKLATRMSPEELASVNADSPIEDQLAKLKHLSEQSIALRGFDLAGNVATGVVNMIPYMAEFALTSGIATAGKVGVGTAVKAALRQGGFTSVREGAKALFTKQGAKAIGQAVKAIATGEAKRLLVYAPKIGVQAYNELNSEPVYFFEEGEVKTVVPEAEVGEMFNLIARKTLETYLGNVSEWAGEFIPGVDLTKLVPERMYPKGLQAKVVQRFLSDISGDATKRAVLKRSLADSVPLQGVLGEVVEEWVNNAFTRASTLAGQATATEFLDMGRDSVFGDAEENVTILLTSIIGSTGGKMARLPSAVKHYHDLTRFVDGHRKMVSAVQDLAGKLPGGVGEAETFLNLARNGDASLLIDPDDAEAFYQTNQAFAEAVGVTEKAISEARDEGRLLVVSQNKMAAEQVKSPDGEAAGEALLSIIQQAGVTVDEARTADIAGEAIDAYKQQQERLKGFRLKIQTAIRAAAKEAGISVRAQEAFAAMAAFQVSYLDQHSTEDGLVDKALDALIVDFQKDPGKYEPAEGLAQAEPADIQAMDDEYFDAIENEDEDKQAAMVEAAASKAGYALGPVYHWGSFDKAHDIPSGPMHFGTERAAEARASGKVVDEFLEEVEAYEGEDGRWHWYDGYGQTSEDLGYEGFDSEEEALEAGMDYVAGTVNTDSQDVFEGGNMTVAYLKADNLKRVKDAGTADKWEKVVEKAKAQGYDGLVYRNEFEDAGNDSYIVFRPEQIKSAEPVEFDGPDIIPLSQRFDAGKADLRYQGEGQYQGRFAPAADFNQSFNALVTLFKGADASTLPHEAAHWVKQMMEAMVANGQADETMANDLATIEAWLDRQEYTSEIGTPDYHRERAEKFARGFEEYIRTGKPPAGGPADAFATLKRLLVSIYRYVTSLGVKLDDEIVSVFDRMISSELAATRDAPMLEAIETLKSTFDSLLGLSQPEAKEFIDLVRKARNQTIDTADAEKAKLLKKKKTEWAKEARAVMKDMKVYNAWAALEAEGGLDYAFIAESPDYGKEIADYFRKRGLTSPMKKSGKDVPLFAENHGYASVDELLSDLMTAKSPREFVKDYLLQQERDFNDEYELSDAAMTTQANVELLEKLAEALAVKAGKEGAVLKRRALAARVQEKLDGTRVKDIVSDSDLVKALRNSGKKLVKALNKQDYNTALELLAGMRFNVEMIRARNEAKRLINKTENLVKRARSAKKGVIFGDHHQAIQELAYYFGFSKSAVNWTENYRRRVGSNDFEGETLGDPFGWPEFLLTQRVERYRDLTYADFTALREFAQFLNGEGRNLVKARKGTFANKVAARVEHALEVLSKQEAKYHDRKTETPLAVKASRTFANWGKNLATFFGKADGWTHVGGDRVRGPNIQLRDLLVSAYGRMIYLENAAKTPCREALLALVESTKGMDLLQGLPKFGGNGALHGYSKWTPEMVVSACLNMGTASGRQRLMEGYQWSEADLGMIAAKLTAADWKHIQRIWDTLSGDLWRAVADTFLEENHYHLNQVDPLEFEVRTADGQVAAMPGGYYPIRYADRSKGKDIALGFQARKLHAEVSSIKRRAETIKHPDPVKLELGVLLTHIHESAHYAATRMANREVLGVVMDPEYRNAFGTTQSFEAYDAMMSILKNAANPAPSTEGITRGFEGWARTVLTSTALMMNPRSALMQFSSVTIGMQELGSHYADAMAEFARGPLEMRASVLRMSALMRHRADYFDIDLKEATDRFDTNLAAKAKKGFAKVGYAAMRGADTLVATIAWKAKYQQAMEELLRTRPFGEASIEAVARADDFVARTQGAARTIDLTPIQLDQFGRMMSTFITSTNAQYNTLLETIGATRAGVLSPGEAFQALAGNLVAPALLGAVIAWVVAGGLMGDDDDDLDRANRYFIQELISNPFAGIPVARDLVDLASTMVASKITGDKVNVFGYNALDAGAVSAASDVFTTLAKGTDALSERDWSRAAWLWADAIGRAAHVPAIRIYERSKRLFEQNGGDLPEVLKDLDKAVKPKEKK